MMNPFLKRWSPYLLKIAMLLRSIEAPDKEDINTKAILGAKSVVDYAVISTLHLFRTELGESEQQRKKRKILEYLANHGGKVTRGQLLRSKVLDGGVKEYDSQLQTLKAEGSVKADEKRSKQSNWRYILA
jgi:hypothetical protein